MFNHFKYHIILIIALIIGSLVLNTLVNSYYRLEEQKHKSHLNKIHSESVLRFETGVNVYATAVSSIRSFIKNSKEFPSEKQLQSFLFDLTEQIKFNDSVVVSLIDTTHTFKYVVTKNKIDPNNLKGINTASLRPKFEIMELNNMMNQDSIILFNPINLKEGWAAFPFNFSVKDKKGKTIGYIATVLNVEYLLNSFYREEDQLFAHRFLVGDNINLTRHAVFDGTKIYNNFTDTEYFTNYNFNIDDFKFTEHNFFGLTIKIGTAYKIKPEINNTIAIVSYLWYVLLFAVTIITIIQFTRNNLLYRKLVAANSVIEIKNVKLEKSISKIKTLIKEIHHRVKNNMQMIASLLLIQEAEYKDEIVKTALEQSRNRIQSMSLLHKNLYSSENLKDVNIKDYINQLLVFIEKTISSDSLIPKKHIQIPFDLILDGDTTVNLGLIMNELITNSYKYAFKENEQNELFIAIIPNTTNSYILKYRDSGQGIKNFDEIDNTNTLGIKLIKILTEQLNGSLSYNKNGENGFIIEFSPAKEVK